MSKLPESKLYIETFFKRRRREVLVLASIALLAAGYVSFKATVSSHYTTAPEKMNLTSGPGKIQTDTFLKQVGQSLIDHHELSHGGWRFKSSIQAPHFQTDRDVGAASVGMGFLALAEAEPHDERWLNGAKETAAWLIEVSSQDGQGGRYWHDYVDDNEVSNDVYTSFDDGAIGIGDFFWQLYERTKDPTYKQVYIESVDWTLAQAEPYRQDGLSGYRWKWNVTDPNSPYYIGMGEGAAGITYGLATAYQRLHQSDPKLAARCKAYMVGSLNYIEIVRKNLAKNIGTSRTIPETGVIGQNGDTELDSGYVSGAAGDAFMYLNLYKIFGSKEYLNQATSILSWLGDSHEGPMVRLGNSSITWKLALDPQGGNNDQYATGVEEGAAGIGWVYLQAYKLTNNEKYLQTAEAAGDWLINVAIKSTGGGLNWHEDEHPTNPLVHSNLDNGAAGIGMFLEDLYVFTKNQKYHIAAQSGLKWLTETAETHDRDIYWNDNGGNDQYSNDPSWHWGLAGIIEFIQRMKGGPQDIIGEQPGFVRQASQK